MYRSEGQEGNKLAGVLLLKSGRLSVFTDRVELKGGTPTGEVEPVPYNRVARTEIDKGWISSNLTIETRASSSMLVEGMPTSDASRAKDLIDYFKDKAAGAVISTVPLLKVAAKNKSVSMRLTVYEDRLEWSSGISRSMTVRLDQVASVHRLRFGLLKSHIEVETTGGGGFGVPNLLPGAAKQAKELIEHLLSELHYKDQGPRQLSKDRLSDVPDQIRKLSELRDAGILTNVEFEAKKADLLGRM